MIAMKDMSVMIWLFPILFMFHDFEEILMMKAWFTRNGAALSKRFPRLFKRMGGHFGSLSTAAFALGVAEEFVIVSVVTIASWLTGSYELWTGLLTAFVIHLAIHVGQAAVLRGYVPALFTSLLCLPVCLMILEWAIGLYSLGTFVVYSVLGFVLMALNLFFIHKAMALFDRFLMRYASGLSTHPPKEEG